MSLEKEQVLGIDLGTTYSAVAQWDGRGPVPVENSVGHYTTPSVVSYDASGSPTVGHTGVTKTRMHPESGIIGVKRHMDEGETPIIVGGKPRTPVEISADILRRVVGDALAKVPGSRVASSVVTVPYYFRAHQCEHTRRAAELASAQCRHILQEPIAAAFDYAFSQRETGPVGADETVLVFDLGGGTFDLTLFNTRTTPDRLRFEVLASGGDDRLGGMDFDERLAEMVVNKAGVELSGLDDRFERRARQKIREAVISAKHELSNEMQAEIILADISAANPEIVVTRAEFEESIAGYLDTIDALLRKTLDDGNVRLEAIDRVIRVGGSSRIPAMKALLDRRIGEAKVWASREMDLTVCRGACLYAAFMDDPEVFGREIEIQTRTSHALGVEIEKGGFKPLIRANRKTPCEARQTFRYYPIPGEADEIRVYQGSAPLVSGNALVGSLNLAELRMREGVQVDLTFKVGADQTLSVVVDVEGRRIGDSFKFA